jgi:hypothetical protein
VKADFKEASVAPDTVERRRLQTLTLAAVFETYFRVLKTSLDPADERWLFPLVVIHALGFPTMLFFSICLKAEELKQFNHHTARFILVLFVVVLLQDKSCCVTQRGWASGNRY